MYTSTYHLGDCRFEVLTRGDHFLGLGAIWIGETKVRSGRLPLSVTTQSFSGQQLGGLRLDTVHEEGGELRINLLADFNPMPVKLMRDHSFDPIHDVGDWDDVPTTEANLAIVIRLASDVFNGVAFEGFDYSYEYDGPDVPIFYLLDRASWEIDGAIAGATAYSQSSCSDPVATFGADTAWSTEGLIHWEDAGAKSNQVMTHNLPRWASHQAFDFQFKGDVTLVGVFERVDLIRSLLCREAGKAELKVFDKHIFDEAAQYATSPKRILINREPKTEVDQKNTWTWVMDETNRRARAEFGLVEQPFVPASHVQFWDNFVIDDYRKDALPSAAAIGLKMVYMDNVNKSSMTERVPRGEEFHWNMCCGHEYEVAPRLGGPAMLKAYVDDCAKVGMSPFGWTNNDQSLASPVNATERDERGWFVKMEDTRLKYGGAYTNIFSILDFKKDEPRQYWVDCLKKIKDETGLSHYLFDSFYNLGFMPVNYASCAPTTQWRELLGAFKELQDHGVTFLIESLGPFGRSLHGGPRSYNLDNIFACYRICLGSGYTTVPTNVDTLVRDAEDVDKLYFTLAHMTDPKIQIFIDDVRIDNVWTEAHKRALADYHNSVPYLHRRYLQEDNRSVIWHDETGSRATIFVFEDKVANLSGAIRDITIGEDIAPGGATPLRARHTYVVTSSALPVRL